MFRGNTRIDRNMLQLLCQLFVAHLIQLNATECDVAFLENTNLFCNRSCRYLVVTGNHNRADAAAFCIGNCLFWDSSLGGSIIEIKPTKV